MNHTDQIIEFRNILRRMERVVLSRIKEASYCSGVTVNQGHILLCIEENRSLTITMLNEELRLDKASLSRTVDTLVKKGLVSREYRSDDRRRQKLRLTEEGKNLVREINNVSIDSFSRVYESLDENIRTHITADLMDLVEAMRLEGNIKTSCFSEREEKGE